MQAHGLYRVPSAEAAVALRGIEETDATRDFVRAVRATLYDLAGPFSRPATFLEARDDRLLLALDDLLQSNPSSPLVAKLWEMSFYLERHILPALDKCFNTRGQFSQERNRRDMRGKRAAWQGRSSVGQNGFIDIQLDDAKSCEPTSTENLLARQGGGDLGISGRLE